MCLDLVSLGDLPLLWLLVSQDDFGIFFAFAQGCVVVTATAHIA